jgi:hypothetical protein
MEPSELLRFAVSALERLGLRYFVTGSTVTIFYGEPRFTNDVDIVVDLPPDAAEAFCDQFPESDFYVSLEGARRAIRQHSQFNIIHPASGLKVDVVIPPPSEFNRSRFSRARLVRTGEGPGVMFSAPEDAILMKMVFFKKGGSEKHLRDITGVLKLSSAEIDVGYISEWASRLGLSDVWEAVLARLRLGPSGSA